jgi:hypothetical protein
MKHTVFIIAAVFFAICAHAQGVQTVVVGSESVQYTDTYQDIENATSYYNGDSLVLTAVDEDGDGSADRWLLYGEDRKVVQEMKDTDGDGEIDVTHTLDGEENILRTQGEEVVAVVEGFVDEAASTGEIDYAGDLTDIEKLAGEGGGFGMWLIIGLLALGGYLWWKRRS